MKPDRRELLEMPKPVAIRRLVLIAAGASLAFTLHASPAARAQDAFDLSVPKADMEDADEPELECAAESLTGSGPGFLSSRKESEDAAINAWLEKARAVYPEADFDLAKDSNLACAVQGLYSKCFADGIPCKPKGGGAASE